MGKTVWIVNEYNMPDDERSRQTNLCRLLNERGYDAYIISGSTSNKRDENRLKRNEKCRYIETDEAKGYIIRTSDYSHNSTRALVALQFQYRVWKYRKNFPKPDVIVSDFAGFFGNVFLKWKKYGTKILFDILDLWPDGFVTMGFLKKDSLITKILYSMEHKSYREADGIIFSFKGGRDYIHDMGWSMETGGDVDTSDIGYLNNGIDLEGVDVQKNEFVLDDPDLNSDRFKAVYLGSVSLFNGLDILVESAKVLRDRGVANILILIYGYGNQEDKLRKMVNEYGLTNIVFKGKLDKRYAMSVLTRCDLNLFTFKNTKALKYGVSPNKLFMYFASGKPVLSMIQPAYDLVEERRAGISVANDPETIADALIRFSTMDDKEYKMYGENAREVAKEYDYKNLVNELIRFIEE